MTTELENFIPDLVRHILSVMEKAHNARVESLIQDNNLCREQYRQLRQELEETIKQQSRNARAEDDGVYYERD